MNVHPKTEHSVAHGTFVIERKFAADPARVFRAWADPEIKARWFGTSEDGQGQLDFRVGGREHSGGMGPNGEHFTFDVLYQDIVPDNRIVYSYDMTMGGRRISVSVAAIELFPDGSGTRMTVTEHGAFLDGLDKMSDREQGTRWLIDQLAAELDRQLKN